MSINVHHPVSSISITPYLFQWTIQKSDEKDILLKRALINLHLSCKLDSNQISSFGSVVTSSGSVLQKNLISGYIILHEG